MYYVPPIGERITALRAELAALPPAQAPSWEPIETAPKDGTPVELFSPGGHAKNCEGGLIWISGGWRDTGGWRGDHYKEPPTHYRLLYPPALAEIAQAKERG